MLSQPISDKGQLQGFQAAAQVLEHLDNRGQHPPSALADGGTSELNREGSDSDKTDCLAAASHTDITVAKDISQHTRHVPTDHLQTGITSPGTPTQQLLSSMQHYTTDVEPLFDETNMIPMSRSEVDALRKDECLQLMTTTSWSSGGGM